MSRKMPFIFSKMPELYKHVILKELYSSPGIYNELPPFDNIYTIRYENKYMHLDYQTLCLLISTYGLYTNNPHLLFINKLPPLTIKPKSKDIVIEDCDYVMIPLFYEFKDKLRQRPC